MSHKYYNAKEREEDRIRSEELQITTKPITEVGYIGEDGKEHRVTLETPLVGGIVDMALQASRIIEQNGLPKRRQTKEQG